MDDIFEQMLSTSPWGDGVGMNRAAWDAVAGGSVNNMGMDLPKVPTMPLNPLMGGGLGNQGFTRALQENNGRMLSDGVFDTHGVHAPHHLQSWNQPYQGGVPPAPSSLSQGKSDTFLLQGEGIRRDVRLGKRVRDEEDMLIEGHPENMVSSQSLQMTIEFCSGACFYSLTTQVLQCLQKRFGLVQVYLATFLKAIVLR